MKNIKEQIHKVHMIIWWKIGIQQKIMHIKMAKPKMDGADMSICQAFMQLWPVKQMYNGGW